MFDNCKETIAPNPAFKFIIQKKVVVNSIHFSIAAITVSPYSPVQFCSFSTYCMYSQQSDVYITTPLYKTFDSFVSISSSYLDVLAAFRLAVEAPYIPLPVTLLYIFETGVD